MHASRRVVALCVMLLWAVGWIPTSGGVARGDDASGAESFGVLGCRDDEGATDAPDAGPDESDDPWLLPSADDRLEPALTAVGATAARSHDLARDRGCLAGSPRGPPAYA